MATSTDAATSHRPSLPRPLLAHLRAVNGDLDARTNLALTALVLFANGALLAALACGAVTLGAALAVLLVLFAPLHWALIHEAVHRLLFRQRALNDAGGRLLAVLFGAPFAVLRFGHLFHHRYNRTALDRTERFARAPSLATHSVYLFRLLGGLWLGEVVLGLATLLPRRLLLWGVRRSCTETPDGLPSLSSQIERDLLAPEALARAREDALALVALLALVTWLLGPAALTFFAMMLGRGTIVSLLDNAFHYDGPLDDLHSAANASLPAPLARAVLNSNYHGMHHRYPRVPWQHLPSTFAVARASGVVAGADGGYFRYLVAQFRGPVFTGEPGQEIAPEQS